MNLRELEARIESVPDLSESTIAAMSSTVANALAFGMARRERIEHREALRMIESGADVTPHLCHLDAYARDWARERNHVRPGNAVNLVRRWRRLALPVEYAHGRSRGGVTMLAPAWAPVVDAFGDIPGLTAQSRKQSRSDVARVARVAFMHGVDGPAELPPRPVLESWLRDGGWSAASIKNAIGAYRRAVGFLAKTSPELKLVRYTTNPHPNARNLRHMPEVDVLIAKTSEELRAYQLTTLEILDHVAPAYANAYREWEVVRSCRPQTKKKLLAAIDRIVAELIRSNQGDALLAGPTALFETIMPDPRAEADGPRGGGAAAAALGLGAAHQRRIPLLWRLFDDVSPNIRSNSPLFAARTFYPPTLQKDLVALFYWMESVYKAVFNEYAPERWTLIESQYKRLSEHMSRVNDEAAIQGTKAKSLLIELITLPQLVAVGMPGMAAHVRILRDEWQALELEAAAKAHTPAVHARVRRAKRKYERRLEQYIALAVLTADPLRQKNWTYARLGHQGEVRPKVEYDGTGHPVRIIEVKSFFTGNGGDNPAAALKVPDKEDRVWTWAPAMIDHDLLLAYIMGPRRERLERRGLITTDYRLESDLVDGRFALFVSPCSTGGHPHAGLAEGYVSDRYGRALHFVVTTVLGRPGVPSYSACGKGKWRGLFAAHVTRLLWGTYWCGVRGEDGPIRLNADGSTSRFSGRQISADATTDLISTIEADYAEVSPVMRDRMRDAARTWEDPRAYDQWMDRAYLLEPINWAAESVPRPESPAGLDTEERRQPRMRRSRRRR